MQRGLGTEKIKKMPIFMTLHFMALYLFFSFDLRSAKVGSGASFFLLCPDRQKLVQKRQISSLFVPKHVQPQILIISPVTNVERCSAGVQSLKRSWCVSHRCRWRECGKTRLLLHQLKTHRDVMPAFPPLRVAVTRVSRAIASAGELAEE